MKLNQLILPQNNQTGLIKQHTACQDYQELQKTAKELESIFLEMMLKSMHEATNALQSSMIDREKENFYQGLLNEELAKQISNSQSIGLKDVIVEQLTHLHQVCNPGDGDE